MRPQVRLDDRVSRRATARELACIVGAVLFGALLLFGRSALPSGKAIPHAVRPAAAPRAAHDTLSLLLARANRVRARLHDAQAFYVAEVAPIEYALRRHARDSMTAKRAALALWRESRRNHFSPWLLVGVLLTENDVLDPRARSAVDARGLMQVMPVHAGGFGCRSRDLDDPVVNICHGVRLLAALRRESGGDVRTMLLRYNGCVDGTNTPDCHRYPASVLARAAEERRHSAPARGD